MVEEPNAQLTIHPIDIALAATGDEGIEHLRNRKKIGELEVVNKCSVNESVTHAERTFASRYLRCREHYVDFCDFVRDVDADAGCVLNPNNAA